MPAAGVGNQRGSAGSGARRRARAQIAEAALREGLPLRQSQWGDCLDWVVESFRISAILDAVERCRP
ncbi:hypothetical protein [Thiorhodococcus minor]|uniref:hypothetical protein n=1 Tax=Thiorhodococcus minor TaxID=57489 RepID=UPI003CC91A8C